MAAMPRSVSVAVAAVAPLLLLLLLSVLVSTAAAARAVGDTTVQDACSKTQFPKVCTESLATKPESAKANQRKLAELFVNIVAEKGNGLATFVQGKTSSAKDDETKFACYNTCSDDVEEAVAHLNGFVREPTDAKFLELKSWLSSTLGGTSTCEEACKDMPKSSDKDDVIKYSLDFERLQRVTLDLINEASGSMSSGIAMPPSDAAAAPSSYGGGGGGSGSSSSSGSGSGSEDAPASAPAGGGGASDSAEGPAASASSPSGAADAPAGGSSSASSGPAAADAPSSSGGSDAPAPSSSDSSSAPGPSSDDSSSAPGPSSDDSSSAPAPSSGGGDSKSKGDGKH